MAAPSFSNSYKGYSSVNSTKTATQYDIQIVIQDLLNNLNTRKGERRGNPAYGSIVWDMPFELQTNANMEKLWNDINNILTAETRIKVNSLNLEQYANGIKLAANLTYIGSGQTFDFITSFNNNLSSSNPTSSEVVQA